MLSPESKNLLRQVQSLAAFPSHLMSKLSSSLQYNKAKSRFFGLLLVLSTLGAILTFILL